MYVRLVALSVLVVMAGAACGRSTPDDSPRAEAPEERNGQCAVEAAETGRRAADTAQIVFAERLTPMIDEFNTLVEADEAGRQGAAQKSYERLRDLFTGVGTTADNFSRAAETAEAVRCEPDQRPEGGKGVCTQRAADAYRKAYVAGGKTLKRHLQPILDDFERLLKSSDNKKVFRQTYLKLFDRLKGMSGEIDSFAALKRKADERLSKCV